MQNVVPEGLLVAVRNERMLGAVIGLDAVSLEDTVFQPHGTGLARRTDKIRLSISLYTGPITRRTRTHRR